MKKRNWKVPLTRRQECRRYVAQVFNLRVRATFQSPGKTIHKLKLELQLAEWKGSVNLKQTMIEKTIGEIEAKIRGADGLDEARKRELLQLLATLKAETAALEKTRYTAREKQATLKNSMDELRSSVEGFEKSHPKIVQLVNSISNTLSNWGI